MYINARKTKLNPTKDEVVSVDLKTTKIINLAVVLEGSSRQTMHQ
jgi:hypothetical protein